MALIYNATFDKNTRKLTFEDKAGNEIYSFTVPERGSGSVDDITKPLTFKATQNRSTVKLRRGNGSPTGDFQTSRDGGNTWTDYTIGTAITLNTGDEVSFRAKADRTSDQNNRSYFYFMMEGKIEAWHNVMSLYRTNDFATYNTVVKYAFFRLFEGCHSLTKAPVLPATTLADGCYDSMFYYCDSLTEAPVLPATTRAAYCYESMFSHSSLTKSPVLTITPLDTYCYRYMFDGCGSLNEVHCQMPSTITGLTRYTEYWLRNVSPTGTFYTNADANWTSGEDGIPEGWSRVNEEAPSVDDVTKPLTFRATQDGSTVTLKKMNSPYGSFQTSRDGGNTWTDYNFNSAITLNIGDEVSFRAKSDRTSAQETQHCFYFEMTGKIEAWHNVMSLYRTNDFATYESVVEYAFYRLFSACTSLVKAPALPATTLAAYCYHSMFLSCRSLTKAPELPATTLTNHCYMYMFSGCQSLKEVRISAATTATDALKNWLNNVSATGDFYCDPNATIFPSGVSGIPQNWVRHALADYPTT